MREALGISKASASIGVRQLEQWAAVKKIWVKGDRRDYYRATTGFATIVRNAVADTIGKRIAAYDALFEETEAVLSPSSAGDEDARGVFTEERMARLHRFYDLARRTAASPVIRALLG